MEEVYIVAAQRTPIGKFGGALAPLTAAQLGAAAIKGALAASGLAAEKVDQVLMGNVIQAGGGQNPARQAAIAAGLPQSVPAITINDVCASGMSSINLGASLIQSGQAQVIVAGGMESMSNAPYLLQRARQGYRFGDGQLVDALQRDGLNDAWGGYPMGMTAENVNDRYQVSREEQDQFALTSHQRAVAAQRQHAFDDEIVPVMVQRRKQTVVVDQDESPRPDTSLSVLSKLKPVFKPNGSVTAGNSSGLNDGGAAVILASREAVEKYQLRPLAQWRASSLVGLDPQLMGLGPYYAVSKLFQTTELTEKDVDIFELNEAFASQTLVSQRLLKLPAAKVNPYGGAIALGHPLGCSGARIIVTLVHQLWSLNQRVGVASLCVGGGMGAATLITR
ncbi:MAG: thiolase family protein [Limosilactobacillus oris]|jgi:acetyl-CoA C-acetyltransferase|uniref:thiolase family protein n=1 Tax=Limosilactobacillus oris TaxID=1632 RepID=UPI0018845C11|nr:thiolase family protein [Limosilactobacillus oris]MBF0600378.1 thiolase family protein [Limosilactobacillus oris]MCH3910605.1 thiolase family protein [Limosilactobacillus oris]MCH3937857.1 thiolase family protein [Limosilactobacillus oris]MCI1979995.1 thiolase family protein [Limosilactobacillus oris]UXC66895.1 thiolase family protein [Limosilactobacillus oris]